MVVSIENTSLRWSGWMISRGAPLATISGVRMPVGSIWTRANISAEPDKADGTGQRHSGTREQHHQRGADRPPEAEALAERAREVAGRGLATGLMLVPWSCFTSRVSGFSASP